MTVIATDRTLWGQLLADNLGCSTSKVPIVSAANLAQLSLPTDAAVLIDGHGVGLLRSYDLIRALNSARSGARAVLLVESSSDLLLRTARRAGACAVACVRDTRDILRDMVANVRRGDFRVSTAATPSPDRRFTARLTERQLETYMLAVSGCSDEEIGQALGITAATAETHRSAVFARLGVHTFNELVLHGVCHGVVTAEEIARGSAIRRSTRVHARGEGGLQPRR